MSDLEQLILGTQDTLPIQVSIAFLFCFVFVSWSGSKSSHQKNCVCRITTKEVHAPNDEGPKGNVHQPAE